MRGVRASLAFFVLALGALGAPLLAGCGVDEAVNPAPGSIFWEACGGGFECAEFAVPVDHDAPGGASFTLPLLRLRAARPEARVGSLLVNPGGPGGSGVAWVRSGAARLPQAIRDRFDVVGFDPRGAAGSEPSIDCIDDIGAFARLDLTPDDEAERQAIVDETDAMVAGCAARMEGILPFVGTDRVARDMDLLREALGDEALTYLGFSYGTLLGAVYAELFPERVRALVLDGAVDPTLPGEVAMAEQGLAFEEQLGDFLADCAVDAACAFHGAGDPAGVYDLIQSEVEISPLPASGDRRLGPGEMMYGVSLSLYRPSRWPRLAEALMLAALDGDGSGLLDLADSYLERDPSGSYGDGLEVYYAVISLDGPFARDVSVYQALTDELAIEAPRLGAYFPYSALPGARWPVAPWRDAAPIAAEGAPPILVVGTTRDPATPYGWSVSLAAQLASGVLLTREGQGHTAFLKGNDCIDAAVTAYLVEGAAPEDGAVCP